MKGHNYGLCRKCGKYHEPTRGKLQRNWTSQEIHILKRVYPTGGPTSVQKFLHNRSADAIYSKATALKVKRIPAWSDTDIKKLKELFPANTVNEISILLGRSWQSIRKKASRLGLKHNINEKRNLHISESKEGKPSPLKGKHFTHKRSIDLNPYPRTVEIRAKISASVRKQYQEGRVTWCKGKRGIFNQETIEKIRKARQRQRIPQNNTKPEREFAKLCSKYNLPFKYVGDSQFWIEDINPDFVECNGRKIAVDIFGDYWHTPLFRQEAIRFSYTEEGRKLILKEYGWKLIVIWESELNLPDAEERILNKLRKVGIKT